MLSDDLSEIGYGVFRHSRDSLILFDPGDHRILGANPTATRTTGFSLGALRSKTLADLFPNERSEPTEGSPFALPEEGARTIERPLLLRTKDHRKVPTLLDLSRIRTSAGSVGLLTMREASDRPVAAEAIGRFVEDSAGLFCVLDARGGFVRLAPAWEGPLGRPVEELKREGFLGRLHPDDVEPVREILRTLTAGGGEVRDFEGRLRLGDGRHVEFSWRAAAVDGLILVRTRGAESDGRSRSRLLACLSHEIRTPLTAILARVDAMLGDPDLRDASVLENLSAVRRGGRHLMEVLDDVLDLSLIEVGKLAVEFRPYSPAVLVDETVALMKPRAEAKGIRLIVERDRSCPATFRTDPTRFRQVLINLVGNAVKYTEAGEIRIRVAVEPPAKSGGPLRLRFDVADTGIGIPPESLPLLFKPFERGRRSSFKSTGAGLGLSISRGLMGLLGGSIEARSEPGRGSTFSLLVDLAPLDEPAPVRRRRLDPASVPMLPTDVLDARVLLVEDSPTNQAAIAMCLRIAGASVEIASNGAEAVERAMASEVEGEPFDAVLMDMQLPVLDGYETTRRLRLGGYRRPIVALTAYACRDTEEECLRIGCDAFVGKPIDWRRLVSLIEELAGDRRDAATGFASGG